MCFNDTVTNSCLPCLEIKVCYKWQIQILSEKTKRYFHKTPDAGWSTGRNLKGLTVQSGPQIWRRRTSRTWIGFTSTKARGPATDQQLFVGETTCWAQVSLEEVLEQSMQTKPQGHRGPNIPAWTEQYSEVKKVRKEDPCYLRLELNTARAV